MQDQDINYIPMKRLQHSHIAFPGGLPETGSGKSGGMLKSMHAHDQ
jgi:hypothetical protein